MSNASSGTAANASTADALIKLIALYLPQYHPIRENDEWWGKGFTEWTNVTRAQPRFRGHYQPHLPADLGFYDLRIPEVREAQAEMAQSHGIYGFCYYHYWFGGMRLLERPFNEVLESGKPDFPFCLCWANENWTRRWDGQDQQVLAGQKYSHEDDVEHFNWLRRAFVDPRYIRIDGKPLFIVYRIGQLPAPKRTAEIWREEAHKAGIGDLFLCNFESNFDRSRANPSEIGFDASIEFQPAPFRPNFLKWFQTGVRRRLTTHKVVAYDDLVTGAVEAPDVPYTRFRCVVPSWDNSARKKQHAYIATGSTPEKYGTWLDAAIRTSRPVGDAGKIVFVNAWNEWAEGNHLEPCQRFGHGYLDATRSVMQKYGWRATPVDSAKSHGNADRLQRVG